jgi:hypothetical protein
VADRDRRPSHHLYVHVPFCRLVCGYCDFVTVGGRREAIPRYVDALLAELAQRPVSGELRTVYFGGGTPSLLAPEAVARLLAAGRARWDVRGALDEVTLEANPSARERPDWAGLRAAGVTRLSLGVQALLYGLAHRRLWQDREWYFLAGSVILGYAAGLATVSTGSVIPAMVGHFAVTMSFFAFAGARLRQRPI